MSKQSQCDKFNAKCPVGTRVEVTLDDGSTIIDVIRHEATLMGGHTPVAWLTKKGSFLLNRVRPVTTNDGDMK